MKSESTETHISSMVDIKVLRYRARPLLMDIVTNSFGLDKQFEGLVLKGPTANLGGLETRHMKARGEDVARIHMILAQLRAKIYNVSNKNY